MSQYPLEGIHLNSPVSRMATRAILEKQAYIKKSPQKGKGLLDVFGDLFPAIGLVNQIRRQQAVAKKTLEGGRIKTKMGKNSKKMKK